MVQSQRDENDLSVLENEWDSVALQTKWKLEHYYKLKDSQQSTSISTGVNQTSLAASDSETP